LAFWFWRRKGPSPPIIGLLLRLCGHRRRQRVIPSMRLYVRDWKRKKFSLRLKPIAQR
jgi:hypothetical protein